MSYNIVWKPIIGQVDGAYLAEAVDSNWIPRLGQTNDCKKLLFTSFLLDVQQ